MRCHLTSLAIATAAVGLGLAWMSQGAAAAQGVELQVSDQGPYGDHLIDAQGMSLYLFKATASSRAPATIPAPRPGRR